jgi:hypothetical protein
MIEAWRIEYAAERPNSALHHQVPAVYRTS